jgi:putative acetyltransferase
MNIDIISYEDKFQPAFKAMNLEWLDRYNLTEQPDLDILNDPRQTILNTGGAIFLARVGEEIIGSAALIHDHGLYELGKMAVAEPYRNRGISRLLIEKCIEEAKAKGASKIVLFSNHQLKAALGLYEKYGFQYIPVEDSPFLTADIKMELIL